MTKTKKEESKSSFKTKHSKKGRKELKIERDKLEKELRQHRALLENEGTEPNSIIIRNLTDEIGWIYNYLNTFKPEKPDNSRERERESRITWNFNWEGGFGANSVLYAG
jgi:hypothetical protein